MNKNENKIQKLQSLLKTGEILNSKQDTDTILDTLLTKSLQLIEGGDAGAIFLYNEETNLLVMRSYKGMGNSVKDVKLKPGESMTGITFVNNKAMFFKDSQAVQKAMSTMQKPNSELALKGNVIASQIHGSICCPLIYRDKTIGVLVIDNLNNETSLREDDVDFLKAISIQATIAIINAQNYESQIENNRKLEKYNRIIKNERNKYKYSTNIHTKFTNMILNGSAINDIIREIKKLMKREVFIIDLFYNITHHTIKNNDDLKLLKEGVTDVVKHLSEKEKIRYYDPEQKIYYNIFPIMVNKETLGWICIISEDADFTELDIITAERGSTILALEFLKQNELSDMEQSLKGDFLDSLLENNNLEYIKKCSKKYRFNLDASHKILAIEFTISSKKYDKQNSYEREIRRSIKNYYKIINEALKPFFKNSISLIKGHMIIIIIEFKSNKNIDKIERFIKALEKKTDSFHYTSFNKCKYKIGISDIFKGINNFKQSYYNSLQALKMIKSYENDKNYVYYKDLEVKRFLMNNDFNELENFVDKVLGPLKTYKNSSKNEFLETLKIYLQSNCNWSKTKDYLHIHGNTLTYRLNRISEILDMDLNNYNDRLRLQIAYEIIDLLKK